MQDDETRQSTIVIAGTVPSASRTGEALRRRQEKRQRQKANKSPEELAAQKEGDAKKLYANLLRLAVKQYIELPGLAYHSDPAMF